MPAKTTQTEKIVRYKKSNLPDWHSEFVNMLKAEYSSRTLSNPRYSLRQWAKQIGMSSGAISELFSGQRKITDQKAIAVAKAAGLKEKQLNLLLAQIGRPAEVVRIQPKRSDVEMIMEWVNHAICGYYEMDALSVDSRIIAERLQRSEKEIIDRTEKLIQNGLLIRNSNGKIFRKQENWDLSLALSPAELEKIRRKAIEFSGAALGSVSSQDSLFQVYTFPGNRGQIEYLRTELHRIFNSLNARVQTEAREELVRFSVQIFPFRFTKKIDFSDV